MESFEYYSKSNSGSPDEGLTHGYGLSAGLFLTQNLSLSYTGTMSLFTESVSGEGLSKLSTKVSDSRSSFWWTVRDPGEKAHIETQAFLNILPIYFVMGLGVHTLDTEDRENITSGIFQQYALHNVIDFPGVDLAPSFHLINPRYRHDGLIKLNGTSLMFLSQLGFSTRGKSDKCKESCSIVALDGSAGFEHSSLTKDQRHRSY